MDAVNKVFKVAKSYRYYFDADLGAFNVAAGDSSVFTISGSTDGVNFTLITTITWYMSADTTFRYSHGSKVSWRYIKNELKGYGSASRATLGKTHLSISRD